MRVLEGERVALRVGVTLGVPVPLGETVAVLLALAPRDSAAVGVRVPVRELEVERVCEGVPVPVRVPVRELEGVLEGLAPLLRLAVGVREPVLELESEPVRVVLLVGV